jgi:hypothetical protein
VGTIHSFSISCWNNSDSFLAANSRWREMRSSILHIRNFVKSCTCKSRLENGEDSLLLLR